MIKFTIKNIKNCFQEHPCKSRKKNRNMLYIITFTNVKKKIIQIFYKDLSTRYDSFFDYDENSLTNEKIEQVLAFQT